MRSWTRDEESCNRKLIPPSGDGTARQVRRKREVERSSKDSQSEAEQRESVESVQILEGGEFAVGGISSRACGLSQ